MSNFNESLVILVVVDYLCLLVIAWLLGRFRAQEARPPHNIVLGDTNGFVFENCVIEEGLSSGIWLDGGDLEWDVTDCKVIYLDDEATDA